MVAPMRKRGALLLLVCLALLGGCSDGDQEAKDRAAAKAAADREAEVGRKLAASVRSARARGAKRRRTRQKRERAQRLKRQREQQAATQQPQQQGAPDAAPGSGAVAARCQGIPMNSTAYTMCINAPGFPDSPDTSGQDGPAAPPASEPDTNGPNDPCPPGTNYVAPDGCVGGDY